MLFKKTFRFRLKPNKRERILFAQFAGACRFVFNRGLAGKKKAFEEEKKNISYYELNNELPSLKKQEETSWLKDIHSQVLQQALKDLDLAFQHFFRRVKNKEAPGYPKFKCKGEHDSFRFPQGVSVEGDKAYLPKIGYVRFKKTREIEGTIKQTTIIREAGNWYICFSCEVEKEVFQPILDETSAIGIDVGLRHYATLAIGNENTLQEIANPRLLKQYLQKLRFLSKNLSRKVLKSRNWYRAKKALQAHYAKLKNCRTDFAHKLSTQVVKNHDIIGVENLSITSLLQAGRTTIARNIADVGWRRFFDCLQYKALHQGKAFIAVNRWFASTKTCSQCRRKHKLTLSDLVLVCPCGLEIGRDQNASINIKNEAIEKLKAAGMSVSKLVELPC
jgi:putative transposase